jgi:hypothetical protein
MRFLFILAILFSLNTIAQERFNGTIVYRLSVPDMDNKADSSARLNVFFGPNAIKLTFFENKKSDNEEIIVSFDSAKIFMLDIPNKTYSTKDMIKTRKHQALPANKNILGYSATAKQILPNSPFNKMLGGAWGEITVYVSDQLNYYLPEEYAGNDEVVFIHNNKIVLEGQATITSTMGLDLSVDGMTFKLEAVSITPQKLDPAMFTIPEGFTKEIAWNLHTDTGYVVADSSAIMFDTIAGILDTSAYWQQEEPVKPAKKPVTPKKKQSTKQATTARKPDL